MLNVRSHLLCIEFTAPAYIIYIFTNTCFNDSSRFTSKGNYFINYSPLGYDYQLFSAQILFNTGLCMLSFGNEIGVKLFYNSIEAAADLAKTDPGISFISYIRH